MSQEQSGGIYTISQSEYVGPTGHQTKVLAKWFIQGDLKFITSIIENYKEDVKEGKKPFWIPDLKQILQNNGYTPYEVSEYNIDWEQ